MASTEPSKPPSEYPEAKLTTKINISEAKNMGLIGAILGLIGMILLIGLIGLIILIIGVILIYVGVAHLSDKINNPTPKSCYLNYLIFNILAGIIGIIAWIAAAFGGLIGLVGLAGLSSLNIAGLISTLLAAIGMFIIPFIIVYVLIIMAAIYLRRSYDIIKTTTKVYMFGTVGYLYYLGAILLIILVGGIIIFIAKILEIAAWGSLPESIELPATVET